MTEQELLTCTDPQPLLEYFQPDEGARKARLFKCACCRRLWHLLSDERSRSGVVLAERIADGEVVPDDELSRAVKDARAVSESKRFWNSGGPHDPLYSLHTAAEAAKDTTSNTGFNALGIARWTANALGAEAQAASKTRPHSERGKAAWDTAHTQAFIVICDYIRDIFGNPFHPVALDSIWLTWNDGTVVKLAEAIYQERAFDRLPILADAFEEAGCHDADILNHCRQPGVHARGCWVIDTILKKS